MTHTRGPPRNLSSWIWRWRRGFPLHSTPDPVAGLALIVLCRVLSFFSCVIWLLASVTMSRKSHTTLHFFLALFLFSLFFPMFVVLPDVTQGVEGQQAAAPDPSCVRDPVLGGVGRTAALGVRASCRASAGVGNSGVGSGGRLTQTRQATLASPLSPAMAPSSALTSPSAMPYAR